MRSARHLITGIGVIVILASCASAPGAGSGTIEPEVQRKPSKSPPPVLQLPADFGVYYESPAGLKTLMSTAAVSSSSPTFIVYLKELPPVDKLFLRFGMGTGPNFFKVMSGELAGVFDAKMSPVDGRPEVYRATYRGELKPGKYMAYTFADVSKGSTPWAEAQFQYAGTIEVGK